jgi:hypothetical protein
MKKWLYAAIGIGVLALAAAVTTRFEFASRSEGLFLLKAEHGALFELKNDLYLGEEGRLIYGIDFGDPRYRLFNIFKAHKPTEPYLYYEWDEDEGDGYVRNFLPGGRQLLTCLSKFKDESGKYVLGVFVGGGLPETVIGDDAVKMDETGMAYYDGKRWYHIWCTANEAIVQASPRKPIFPSDWEYLGSNVVDEGGKALTIRSRHGVVLDGAPLRIERMARFRAGDPYFVLNIKIINTGRKTAGYYYLYGDEPWVGDYGTSAGNVGWVKGRIINHETALDVDQYAYAGLYDYGNDAIGEGHEFSMAADFIEWMGEVKPTKLYFSNAPGVVYKNVPLKSDTRFIGLEWGPRQLRPGGSDSITLAIGMAPHDVKTGIPVKPDVKLDFTP